MRRVLIVMLSALIVTAGLGASSGSAHAFSGFEGQFEPGYWHDSNANGVELPSWVDFGRTRADWMRSLPDDLTLGDLTLPGTHDSGTWDTGHLELVGWLQKLIDDGVKGGGFLAGATAVLGGAAFVIPGFLPAFLLLEALLAILPSAIDTIIRNLAQTQTMNFDTQLNAGIRALDIRLGHQDGNDCSDPAALHVVHSVFVCFSDETLKTVLGSVDSFLNRHPSETVVMRIDSDSLDGTDADANAFDSNVRTLLTSDAHVFMPAQSTQPECDPKNAAFDPENMSCIETNPTLGETRGKIVILQDWKSHKSAGKVDERWFGIPYPSGDDSSFTSRGWSVQDHYNPGTLYGLGYKYASVEDQFNKANALTKDSPGGGRSINFLSAAGDALPYSWASGKGDEYGTYGTQFITPWVEGVDCHAPACLRNDTPGGGFYEEAGWDYFKGINELALEHIEYYTDWNHLGIVYADFPGPGHNDSSDDYEHREGLIGTLIDVNFRQHPFPPQIGMQFSGKPEPDGAWDPPNTFTTLTYTISNDNGVSPNSKKINFSDVRFTLPSLTDFTPSQLFSEKETTAYPGQEVADTCKFKFDPLQPDGRHLVGSVPFNSVCALTWSIYSDFDRTEPGARVGTWRESATVQGQASAGPVLIGNTANQTLYVGDKQPEWIVFHTAVGQSARSEDPSSTYAQTNGGYIDGPDDPNLVGHTLQNFASGPSTSAVIYTVDAATTNNACTLIVTPPGPTPVSFKQGFWPLFTYGNKSPQYVYQVSLDHPGRCVIDANQAGDDTYMDAPQAQEAFDVVTKGDQIITFTNKPPKPGFVNQTTTVSATGGGSLNPVTLTVDPDRTINNACHTSNPTRTPGDIDIFTVYSVDVSLDHDGYCVIHARQDGNDSYYEADNSQGFFVNLSTSQLPAPQVIDTVLPTNPTVGAKDKIFSAYNPDGSPSSGNPIYLYPDAKTTNNACQIDSQFPTAVNPPAQGAFLSFPHVGQCVIDAFQDGDQNHLYGYASVTFLVNPAVQSLEFKNPLPPRPVVGGTYQVTVQANADGNSGNPVVFSVDSAATTNDACSIDPNGAVSAVDANGFATATVTFDHAGTCVVDANRDGNADYLPAQQVQQSVDITAPASLTITASSPTISYGQAAPTITPGYQGLVNGDTAPATAPTCTVNIPADHRKSNGNPIVGTYPTSCTGASDPNYTIAYVSGTLTVNPAPLTITAGSATITYGQAVPSIVPSYSGLVNSDNGPATAPTCTATIPTTDVAGNGNPDAGTYTTNCSGASDPNYGPISYVTGTLTVNPAALTITAASPTITYGQPVPAVAPSYAGLVNGDNGPATAPTCVANIQAADLAGNGNPHAGTYTTSCSGASDPNYGPISYVTGTLTVNPAALTITAGSATITYGQAVPSIVPSYSGLVNGDNGPATAPTCTATIPTTDVASNGNPDAGTYSTSCSGASDPNYGPISYVAGTLTVNQAALTITAASPTITYGQAVPAVAPSYAGLVNGDNAPANPPTCTATIPTADLAGNGNPDAGTYTTSCSGASDPNYGPIAYVAGTLTVNPAPLTITANNKTMDYSDPIPVLDASISGFENGDTAAVLGSAVSCTTTGTPASPAGTYPIDCGIAAPPPTNYALLFVPGVLTITAEGAWLRYTGEVIAPVGGTLQLRAQIWDNAAAGYPGPDPETGAPNGDITEAWVEFDVYPAGSCGTGSAASVFAPTVAVGPGIGVSSASFTSASAASDCVIAKLVAGPTGGTNQFFSAPNAQADGITFYNNTGQFVTGGGWITDPNTNGRDNFGFNARYAKNGTPNGEFTYVARGMYNGVLADFTIKSDEITALAFSGSTDPITATLQGNGSIQINRASDGASLYSDGPVTFTARATDAGTGKNAGPDTIALTLYTKSGALLDTIANTSLGGGDITVHHGK
jgi:hypothetical protein